MQLTRQNLPNDMHNANVHVLRGDTNFKRSDSSEPSVYFLLCACSFKYKFYLIQVNNLDIAVPWKKTE